MEFFKSKKKKITEYLSQKSGSMTAFDVLLQDHLSGKLTETLAEYGISGIECHIDWLSDYKCIGIQGKYESYFLDLQIEEDVFRIAADEDEPDDPAEYPLTTADAFYQSIKDFLGKIPA